MMSDPGPLLGNGPLETWLNRLRRMVISNRLLNAPGIRFSETPQGIIPEILAKSGGGTAPETTQQYAFVAHGAADPSTPNANDYITCTAYGSTSQVSILKPPELFFSTASRSVGGQVITYTLYDSAKQSRLATNTVGAVSQIITPRYAPGDVIFAEKVTFNGKSVLLDKNVGARAFSAPSLTA